MKIRDRIRELRRVRAGDLCPNPRNWRTHPQQQVAALEALLGEIGYADAVLARELPGGELEIVDGHLRQALDPDQVLPVLVLDIDQDEANRLLTVLDPLAGMAEANPEALSLLLAEIDSESEELQAILDGLAKENHLPAADEQLDERPDSRDRPTAASPSRARAADESRDTAVYGIMLPCKKADLAVLCRFLGVRKLPDDAGAAVLRRIKTLTKPAAAKKKPSKRRKA